jgi:hypothetical protein
MFIPHQYIFFILRMLLVGYKAYYIFLVLLAFSTHVKGSRYYWGGALLFPSPVIA